VTVFHGHFTLLIQKKVADGVIGEIIESISNRFHRKVNVFSKITSNKQEAIPVQSLGNKVGQEA
jgi:hypothetical protein